MASVDKMKPDIKWNVEERTQYNWTSIYFIYTFDRHKWHNGLLSRVHPQQHSRKVARPVKGFDQKHYYLEKKLKWANDYLKTQESSSQESMNCWSKWWSFGNRPLGNQSVCSGWIFADRMLPASFGILWWPLWREKTKEMHYFFCSTRSFKKGILQLATKLGKVFQKLSTNF